MKKIISKIQTLFIVFLGGFVLPGILYAQGIVPCGPGSTTGKDCTLQDIGNLINSIIDFLLKITIPFAIVAFAVGGFFMIMGAANEGNIARGKEIMKSTVYGMFTVFLAWILVKAILVAIGFDLDLGWIK